MALASNPVFHARTKHFEIHYHFIKFLLANKIVLHCIGTNAQKISSQKAWFSFLMSKVMDGEPPMTH